MKHIPLSEIVKKINGRVTNGLENPIIKGVTKRTKKNIDDHTLLFHFNRDSIKGKYWNGRQSIAVVTDAPEQCEELGDQILLVEVNSVEEAYWNFIDYYRNLFQIPVIGVTGTCGKTTTKEMITQILVKDFNVEGTWMSMNSMSVNLRYLTKIDDETEIAVYEMPVAYPGYLRIACKYFQPQIRILLNIGVHHLADCETPEAYMKAKAEIVEGLDPINGILILNDDDENIKKVVNISPYQNVLYFGKEETAHFQADNIRYGNKGMNFTLIHKGTSYEVFVPGYGEHNVYNALAAIAAVSFAGVGIKTAVERLADFEHVEEHLEVKHGVNECTIIDDSWNSAPLSMETGLQVLKDISSQKTSIALLGYMPQLGEGHFANEQYSIMGEKAVETDVDLLIVVGKEAEKIGLRALELGMDRKKVHFCESGTEIYDIVKPYLKEDTVIYLKITYRVMKQPSFKEMKAKLIQGENE